MSDSKFIIRHAGTNDRPAILAVLIDAFKQEDEARLVDRLWMAGAMSDEFVAEQGGKIIGYCAFSPITSNPVLAGDTLGLAPVAVATGQQRKGAGTALVNRGLDECNAKGVDLITVLGEPEYYTRFGFKPAAQFNLAWSAMDAGDAFQAIDATSITDETPRKIDYHQAFTEI